MKIRKNDTVRLISGNERGKQGKVLSVLPREGRIAVEGVNLKKKHVRPKRAGQKGELVRIPALFPASRAMLLCPACGEPTRVRYQAGEKGNVRTCRKCGKPF